MICESGPFSHTTFINSHSFQFYHTRYFLNLQICQSRKMYRLSSRVISLSLLLFSRSCWSAPFSTATNKRSAVLPSMVGSPVIFGQGTYPRANSLSDPSLPAGSIIGAYTAFSDGDNVLEIVMSTDNGTSWQGIGEVTRGSSNANDIDNPYVLQLPSGYVHFRNRNLLFQTVNRNAGHDSGAKSSRYPFGLCQRSGFCLKEVTLTPKPLQPRSLRVQEPFQRPQHWSLLVLSHHRGLFRRLRQDMDLPFHPILGSWTCQWKLGAFSP